MARPKLTVVFDAHPLLGQKTGVGYYTAQLIEHLAKLDLEGLELVGYYNNFLLRKRVTGLPSAPNIHYRRIAFIPGQIINLLRRFHIWLPLELLTGLRPDFILYPNFLGLRSMRRTPNAPVIHDLSYFDHPEYASARNARDLTRFVPAMLRQASFVLTVSKVSKQRIAELYGTPMEQILVTPIPPAIPSILAPARTKELLGGQDIPGSYIFFIGTLEPRKNLVTLLDAYTRLSPELRSRYALILAGKTDWKFKSTIDKIKQLQADGYPVRYIGYADDELRSALYSRASLVVLPSHYEGFGMQLLEAMTFGAPVAASDLPVFREVAGPAAAYFEQTDAGDIADTMTSLLQNTSQREALQAKAETQLKLYDWDKVANDIYDKIRKSIDG